MENRFFLKSIKKIFLNVCFLVLIFPTVSCALPLKYSSEEIRGTIVDAETGQPIEGVVVSAYWDVNKLHLAFGDVGSGTERTLIKFEVVTDKEGNYLIPAWGPKWVSVLEYMGGNDSYLIFFKSGYRRKGVSNIELEILDRYYNLSKLDDKKLEHDPYNPFGITGFRTRFEEAVSRVARKTKKAPSYRKSVWNGRAIRLKKLTIGEEINYLDHNGRRATRKVSEDDLYSQINTIYRTKNTCREILKERSRFSSEKYLQKRVFVDCLKLMKEDVE